MMQPPPSGLPAGASHWNPPRSALQTLLVRCIAPGQWTANRTAGWPGQWKTMHWKGRNHPLMQIAATAFRLCLRALTV